MCVCLRGDREREKQKKGGEKEKRGESGNQVNKEVLRDETKYFIYLFILYTYLFKLLSLSCLLCCKGFGRCTLQPSYLSYNVSEFCTEIFIQSKGTDCSESALRARGDKSEV